MFFIALSVGPALATGIPYDPETQGDTIMLSYALTFFIIAIIAAVLGFTGIAGAAAGIAQVLFFLFIVLFFISLLAGALRGRPPL